MELTPQIRVPIESYSHEKTLARLCGSDNGFLPDPGRGRDSHLPRDATDSRQVCHHRRRHAGRQWRDRRGPKHLAVDGRHAGRQRPGTGSARGQGSYVAPDWTADWLHREAVFILDKWGSEKSGKPIAELSDEQQGQLTGRLIEQFHTNNYDASTGIVTISRIRAEAFASNVEHYKTVFIEGNAD